MKGGLFIIESLVVKNPLANVGSIRDVVSNPGSSNGRWTQIESSFLKVCGSCLPFFLVRCIVKV